MWKILQIFKNFFAQFSFCFSRPSRQSLFVWLVSSLCTLQNEQNPKLTVPFNRQQRETLVYGVAECARSLCTPKDIGTNGHNKKSEIFSEIGDDLHAPGPKTPWRIWWGAENRVGLERVHRISLLKHKQNHHHSALKYSTGSPLYQLNLFSPVSGCSPGPLAALYSYSLFSTLIYYRRAFVLKNPGSSLNAPH